MVDVGDLRWKLFTKKQLQAEKLPPRGALHEAIARAHYQAMVWRQDNISHRHLPPATTYGWKEEKDRGGMQHLTTLATAVPEIWLLTT